MNTGATFTQTTGNFEFTQGGSFDGATTISGSTLVLNGGATTFTFVDGTTWSRLVGMGTDPAAALARNDSWGAFEQLGDLFVTGPTGTNVNDFRAVLVTE